MFAASSPICFKPASILLPATDGKPILKEFFGLPLLKKIWPGSISTPLYEKLPHRLATFIRQFWKLMIILVGIVLIVYGIELVEGMRGKYWEMWHFEFTAEGVQFKENYMPKKYAVMILPIAGFLTAFGAAICFLKKL